jgi:hypothetical protein
MNARNATLGSGGWLLALILSLLFSMVLGLALIWLSIDRNDTAYAIHKAQEELEAVRAHVGKLEVERDTLLSPHILEKKAEQLGMGMADPGQVRRMEQNPGSSPADASAGRQD